MTIDRYLFLVFLLAVPVNLLSTLMFLGRVHWPDRASLFGNLALLLGIPALVLAVVGMINQVGLLTWLMPLLYALFCVVGLCLDVVWKVEFRQPRRPKILVPFLLLYFVPLIGMWGMLWALGLVYWAIAGVTYFAMLGSSFYASRQGVG